MATVEVGGHYESALAKPASATKTDVLTCPVGHWYLVIDINVCASAGSAGTVDIIKYDTAAAAEYTIRYHAVVPAADAYNPSDFGPEVMNPGDVLRFTPSNAGQHVRVSYLVIRKGDPAGARLA